MSLKERNGRRACKARSGKVCYTVLRPSVKPMNRIVLSALLAVVPSLALLLALMTKTDSRARLLWAFAAGYFAVIPALLAEIAVSPWQTRQTSLLGLLVRSFAVTGLFEEGTKLALIWAFLRRRTREPPSKPLWKAISIAAVVAAGFAGFENVMYAPDEISIVLVRGITAVPLHVAASVAMAWTLVHRYSATLRGIVPALATGVSIHGVYNLLLFLPSPAPLFAAPYSAFMAMAVVRLFRRACDDRRNSKSAGADSRRRRRTRIERIDAERSDPEKRGE